MRVAIATMLFAGLLSTSVVHADDHKAKTEPAAKQTKEEKKLTNPVVAMHTNHGVIAVELDQQKAPKTVENFLSYVEDGFYNGTVFHRVIPGFMIQGGGFTEDMNQKPTKGNIDNEANNGLKNDTGTIAMARTRDPHSATAQFFINVNDNNFLNFKDESIQGWGYAVFGKVTEGMDIVQKIEKVKTGRHGMHQDVPVETVVIEKVTVLNAAE